MKPPVVGKRYYCWVSRVSWVVGTCTSAKGLFWEFKLERLVEGMSRDWGIGDVISVRASWVEELREVPFDAEG